MLAAGFSRRFGSDKRRARLGNGQTLLAASLALPCTVLEEVWVVLRPEDDPRELSVPRGVRVLHSAHTAHGMGHSLADGVRSLAPHSEAEVLAIFLGDMPWIGAESLRCLLAQAAPDAIVVPTFAGQPGHPVLFGRSFWPELQLLRGDSGAREVIRANPQAVRRVAVSDPAIMRDVDTPQCIE
jgi:molybdenum cofactor cytidylyltransferase